MTDSTSHKRIAYVPWFEASVEKGYTLRMRELLGAFGEVVAFRGFGEALRSNLRSRRGRLDVVVLNWTDNDLLDRRTKTVALRKVAKLFARTFALRLVAKQLVFVRHNNFPHAVAHGHEAEAARWVDRYERLFDTVLTHSGEEQQLPRRYCPHPLYHRVPIADGTRASLGWLPSHYFVVFGRIVRYKKLAELMRAFPADRTLLVLGAIGDQAYAKELASIERPNVVFKPGLIDETDAQAIVANSAALLISHADEDVIVSSSFFFAMSLRVPVIAVATPYLRWVAPRVGPDLLRLASDVEGLCERLDEAIDDPKSDAEATGTIEREFGDDTVRGALLAALGHGFHDDSLSRKKHLT
jgi:glycosyltransferase involved in cell wall biosynthesis